jgi:hypothetical protein
MFEDAIGGSQDAIRELALAELDAIRELSVNELEIVAGGDIDMDTVYPDPFPWPIPKPTCGHPR